MFPRVWVSKPSPNPCLSWMYNLKGFCKLVNLSAGAKTSFSFKVSNATLQSLVHSKGWEFSLFKESYSGFAISPKFGIQIWQNPVIPNNPCLWFSQSFSIAMTCFLSAIRLLLQLKSQVWHLLFAKLGLVRRYLISPFGQVIEDGGGVKQAVLMGAASYQYVIYILQKNSWSQSNIP